LACCIVAITADLVWPTTSPGERELTKFSGFNFDPLQRQWVEVIKRDSRFALFTQLAIQVLKKKTHIKKEAQ
jgi:hypothetical protein